MDPPAKRRRLGDSCTNGDTNEEQRYFSSEALAPATAEEKKLWQGFCEIESEPAFFNVMLKDFGVKGVKVQEVFGLDEELLSMLPKPVYGLIFLFRYKADDINNQEATCPDNVWFANQTADHSCATVSLLNIVYNIRDAHLGEHLQAFKDYTKDFTPALRGEAIGNFTFIKQIHNSFARKMDMLNIDLGMGNSYSDRKKRKDTAASNGATKKGSKQTSKKKKGVITDEDYTDEDAAFHFSAYVPIDGTVWKLDGLDRQPERIGRYNDDEDWLSVVSPVIQDRMFTYAEGQIEFSLLSLVKDPVDTHRAELAQNIKSIQHLDGQLKSCEDGSGLGITGDDDPTTAIDAFGPDAILGVTEEMIKETSVPQETEDAVREAAGASGTLLLGSMRRDLVSEHRRLRREVLDEIDSNRSDERRAWERRQDYGPAIHAWLRMLAGKEGVLKELIDDMKARNVAEAFD